MMKIKKPLITRIVGNRHACSLLIAIIFLFTETGYSANGPSKLRPALQFSETGRKATKEGIKGGEQNSPVCLHEVESMSREEKIRYSRFKLGDNNAIEDFARQIFARISEEVGVQISTNPEDWVLVGGPFLEPKNCIYYLCDILVNELGITRVTINRKRYKGPALYSQSSLDVKRKISQETLYFDGSVSVKGKNVIFVDDCLASGGIYGRSRGLLLENGAKSVRAYIITRINNPVVYPEIDLDRTVVTEGGVEEILNILKGSRNVITSRLITVLSMLAEKDIVYLVNKLNK